MAVQYIARKCTQCAGKLEYIKEKKTWKCLYCGAEIERAEQYDGLFTIKNVVRQTLLDVAYRRLDSAEKNLVECEKIDSRYVGTMIAKIAYQMVMAITPGAYPQGELRHVFSQLKRNYDALQAIEQNITGDEEVLYEFFDSADVYATLLLVYDSLNDGMRRDYMAELLDAAQVYAKEPNHNLLSYALKNEKYDLFDQILNSSGNVEPVFALRELLQNYPDNGNKCRNMETLLNAHPLEREAQKIVEAYLADSSDCLVTKGKMVVLAHGAGITVSLEEIVTHLLTKAGRETVEEVLRQVCSARLPDEHVYQMVEFAISADLPDVMMTALMVLKETNQYVVMAPKYMIALLSRTDLSASDQTRVLHQLLSFQVDAKSKDAVVRHYLCVNQHGVEIRMEVIHVLLKAVTTIQTGTVENYVLNVNTDGVNKSRVVEQIFALDLNLNFFQDLLAQYIGSKVDTKEVKDKVAALLVGKGLKLSPSDFTAYICSSAALAEDKVDFVKRMLSNGVQLRGDTVNAYLENITSDQFHSDLLAFIISSASNISELALSNYLLHCKEKDELKIRNFMTLAALCHKNVADIYCDAWCVGQKISGNLLPVYLLSTPDSFEVTKEIADFLISRKAKFNAEIQLAGTKALKLKKFVSQNIGELSPASGQICAAYKLS